MRNSQLFPFRDHDDCIRVTEIILTFLMKSTTKFDVSVVVIRKGDMDTACLFNVN